MDKEYFTTFEAAKLMSVSPDAVLKWIKSGILEARRTPGGHHRIAQKSIEELLAKSQRVFKSDENQQVYQYCWEYNAHQRNCFDKCEECIVFTTSAKRCYKLYDFPTELGHLRLYCETSCEECNYYKFVQSDN